MRRGGDAGVHAKGSERVLPLIPSSLTGATVWRPLARARENTRCTTRTHRARPKRCRENARLSETCDLIMRFLSLLFGLPP